MFGALRNYDCKVAKSVGGNFVLLHGGSRQLIPGLTPRLVSHFMGQYRYAHSTQRTTWETTPNLLHGLVDNVVECRKTAQISLALASTNLSCARDDIALHIGGDYDPVEVSVFDANTQTATAIDLVTIGFADKQHKVPSHIGCVEIKEIGMSRARLLRELDCNRALQLDRIGLAQAQASITADFFQRSLKAGIEVVPYVLVLCNDGPAMYYPPVPFRRKICELWRTTIQHEKPLKNQPLRYLNEHEI